MLRLIQRAGIGKGPPNFRTMFKRQFRNYLLQDSLESPSRTSNRHFKGGPKTSTWRLDGRRCTILPAMRALVYTWRAGSFQHDLGHLRDSTWGTTNSNHMRGKTWEPNLLAYALKLGNPTGATCVAKTGGPRARTTCAAKIWNPIWFTDAAELYLWAICAAKLGDPPIRTTCAAKPENKTRESDLGLLSLQYLGGGTDSNATNLLWHHDTTTVPRYV